MAARVIIPMMGFESGRQFIKRGRLLRWCLLILGILAPQVWMISGSLTGEKVMLPLDSFVSYYPAFYPEASQEERQAVGPPRWPNGVDAILFNEPFRRYAVGELHAGRLPTWNPYNYAGAPFIGNGQSAVFSPYRLIEYLSMDPVVLAWSQLAKALVAGLGMYFFLRRGLGLSWQAATAGAWLYPLTGYMTLWNGMSLAAGATWLGWVLGATELAMRRPGVKWPVALGVFVCFTFLAGHPQIAGHTLMMSVGYAVARAGMQWWRGGKVVVVAQRLSRCGAGWLLGLCLAAPQLLTQALYTVDTARFALRAGGTVERQGQGPWALMQVVQPWIAGDISSSSIYLLTSNRQESGAGGYAGLLALFVLAPLAWRMKRWRGQAFIWACVAVLGVSAVAGLPVLEKLVTAGPLGMLSGNRMACLTAFALVVLAGLGVNALVRPTGGQAGASRLWMLWPGAALALVLFLGMQMEHLRERMGPGVAALTQGSTQEHVERVTLYLEAWFQGQFLVTIGLLLASACLYGVLARPGAGMGFKRAMVWVVVVLSVGEMTYMAYPAFAQVDRRWYPDSPKLVERIKELGPGRIVGLDTLVPNVNLWWRLESVMGYDALDPAAMTTLIRSATDKPASQKYAALLAFEPSGRMGVLRALNVEYLAASGELLGLGPPVLRAERFYVYRVPGAMARVYVPRQVRTIKDPGQVLAMMNQPGFDPGALGLVEGSGDLAFENITGDAKVLPGEPGHVTVSVEMHTPGMVVLADAYAAGWEATYNGKPVTIAKANYALKGVVVPAGKGTLEFSYRPPGFKWGLVIMAGAVVAVLAAALGNARAKRAERA